MSSGRRFLSPKLRERLRALKEERAIPRRPDAAAPAPLSFAQERLWLTQMMAPDDPAHNEQAALRLQGALRVDVLEQAFAGVVARHAVLRTRVRMIDGEPRQIVDPAGRCPFARVDLPAQEGPTAWTQLAKAAAVEKATRIDLATGPVLRATAFRIAADDHVLLFTFHHVAIDGWSLGIFVRELRALYLALADGVESQLLPLPIDYADFATWQRRQAGAAALRDDLAYWRTALEGAPPFLELPVDRPYPEHREHAGGRHGFRLRARSTDPLDAAARAAGATPFMAYLAAYAVLLHGATRAPELVVGTQVSGRNVTDVDDLLGCFLNVVPLRLAVRESSFADLVQAVRAVCTEAFAHQEAPLQSILDVCRTARSSSRQPLFQVTFDLQNFPQSGLDLPGLRVSLVELANPTTKFELGLQLAEQADGLAARFEYDRDILDPTTIRRMADDYVSIVDMVAANPRTRVDHLLEQAGSRARRHQRAIEWNDSAARWEPASSVVAWFLGTAASAPERIAVSFEGTTCTYAELAARVEALAARLAAMGVGLESRVILHVTRSIDWIVGMLGVLRCGAAFVPIDPASPAERASYMLSDASPAVILVAAGAPPPAAATPRVPVVDIPHAAVALAASPSAPPPPPGGAAAYVLYTSGSTGQPKAVVNTHAGLMNHMRWFAEAYAMRPSDAMLSKTSMMFDVAVWEALWPLLVGGRLVVVARGAEHDTDVLTRVIERERITHVHFVASMLQTFLSSADLSRCTSVREVFTSGEAVPVELQRLHTARWGVALHDLYGPTEAAIHVGAWRCSPEDAIVPVGRPVANVQLLVADEHLRPCSMGVVGELWVGGVQVARGYLNQPALTAERFLPSPRGRGERLYRTGDLARQRRDGCIEFLGRTDAQVKIRGFRIELGEIEAQLGALPGVREAAVGTEGDGLGTRLVAWVAFHGAALAASELRAGLKDRLPDYMVPATFVELGHLPRTSSGKVDRRALPRGSAAGPRGAWRAPTGPMQELLAAIWCEVLELERFGVDDDFFELGGHSLSATQIVARVRQALGLELAVRTVFEAPTLASFAERVERAGATPRPPMPPIVPARREGPLPLSHAQERLWFLHHLDPGGAAYNVPLALRLQGPLDVPALERTFVELVGRHEAVRTTFVATGGAPRQTVRPAPATFDLPRLCIDAGALAGEVAAEVVRAFDLERGPLLRARLLGLGEEEHVLLVTMHHIVTDGWSMDLILAETSALYAAFSTGRASPLPPPALQYPDYAVWQRSWLSGGELDRQLAYWRAQLAALPVLELPTDRPRPAVQSTRGAVFDLDLPAAALASLGALARRTASSPFMTWLAAFSVLLGRQTGQGDIAVGTPIAGRTRRETETLVGLLVNTLVLRCKVRPDASFTETLQGVKEVTLAAYAHQDAPFEQVVDAVAPARDTSRTPLFQVMVVHRAAGLRREAPPALGNLTIAPLAFEAHTAKLDLTLTLTEHAEGVRAAFEYNTDLFDRSTILRLAASWRTLVAAVTAAPERPVGCLELLNRHERAQLLVEWNDTARVQTDVGRVHQLVERAARATPDAIAVWAGAERASFREIDARSTALAHRLAEAGVGVEAIVGVCLERSTEMVVSLLAVLKAGAAYLPLDPAYPAARLAFMLDDAGARVLLTGPGAPPGIAGPDRLVLDSSTEHPPARSRRALPTAPGSALAYVLYTSGSTGRPKGVMVSHDGLTCYVDHAIRTYGIAEGTGTPVHSSFAFDLTVTSLLAPLAAGRTVLLVPAEDALEGLGRVLREQRDLTLVKITPAHLDVLAEQLAPEQAPGRVRTLVIGGESLSADRLAFWRSHAPGTRLVNEYGPTEAVVGCAIHEVSPADPATGPVPIGRPIQGTQLYVLQGWLQPVPMGAAGELYIGGEQLARGYQGQPDSTADRFVPDPFAGRPGARLYRTGDRVRARADGRLVYLGRDDGQVKVRGHRIELGEIEAALLTYPGLRSAAVMLRNDTPGGPRLVAWVAPAPIEPEGLRAHLRRTLPEHMVPAALVCLEHLPLTPNGKVDRGALPVPEAPVAGSVAAPPRTEREALLADIWARVLQVERVDIHANFFELGGDSILSIQIIARAQALGLHLTARQVFEHPTVFELARAASAQRAVVAPQGPVTGSIPLTPIQAWFFDRALPHPEHHNQAVVLEVDGRFDAAQLRRAMEALVAHHDALRVRYVATGDGWRAHGVATEPAAPVRELDLTGLAVEEQDAAFLRAAEEAQRSLNLAEGPLLRVLHVRTRAGVRLVWVVHHLAVDGVSWRILLDDLRAVGEQLAAGLQARLPPKTTSVQTWAERLRELAASEDTARELAYWSGLPWDAVVALPAKGDPTPGRWGDAATVTRSLAAAETSALLRAGRERLRVDEILVTALAEAFASWTGVRTLLLSLEGWDPLESTCRHASLSIL